MRYKLLVVLVILGCTGDLEPDISKPSLRMDFEIILDHLHTKLIPAIQQLISLVLNVFDFVMRLLLLDYEQFVIYYQNFIFPTVFEHFLQILYDVLLFLDVFTDCFLPVWDFIAEPLLTHYITSLISVYTDYITHATPSLCLLSFRPGRFYFSYQGCMRVRVYVCRYRGWLLASARILHNIRGAVYLLPPGTLYNFDYRPGPALKTM